MKGNLRNRIVFIFIQGRLWHLPHFLISRKVSKLFLFNYLMAMTGYNFYRWIFKRLRIIPFLQKQLVPDYFFCILYLTLIYFPPYTLICHMISCWRFFMDKLNSVLMVETSYPLFLKNIWSKTGWRKHRIFFFFFYKVVKHLLESCYFELGDEIWPSTFLCQPNTKSVAHIVVARTFDYAWF